MKRLLCTLLATAMLVTSLAACGDKNPSSQGDSGNKDLGELVVATVPKSIGSNWFDSCDWQGQEWAEKNNAKHHYIGPTSMDSAAQLQCLSDAIALQPDVLTVIPIAADAVDELLKQAKDMGTKVVTHEGSSLQNIDYNVDAFDNTKFGEAFADKAAELAGKDASYAIMVGRLTVPSHMAWAKAFYDHATKAYPDMKTVNDVSNNAIVPVEGMDNSDTSYSVTKQLLQANPDLDVLFVTSGSSVGGAARAVEELGLSGKIKLLAVGTASGQKSYYKSGTITYGAFWYPGYAQYACYEVGKRLLEGKEIKTGDDLGVTGFENITVDGKNIYGNFWYDITQENVDEMAELL